MTSHLVNEFLARGHRVSVITSGSDITGPRAISVGNLHVTVVPSRPRARDRALDLFKDERAGIARAIDSRSPDVVHAHWTYEFALAAIGSRRPTLVTVHDWAPAILAQARDPYRAIRLVMQILTIATSQHLTAPSMYVAEKVRRYFRKDCVVVPNCIGAPSLSRSAVPTAHKVAMLNAADGRRKNVREALRAWPQVLRAFPNATLVVAGPPFGSKSETALWAGANGLNHNVDFAGAIEAHAVGDWLGSHAAFLHPSREESFGNVIVEAMAAGVPVIAGERSGAVPEVVGDAGILVDIRSATEIASAVIRVLGDDLLRGGMVSLGRERASLFSVPRVADQYLTILARLSTEEPLNPTVKTKE